MADGLNGNLALKGLGYFEGKVHILPISIYYEDTDLSGMVYHANYLRYMERGRTEFFRLAGISRARLDDEEPTAWTLRRIAVEYFRPARLDDQIAVHSVLTDVSGARLKVLQRVRRGADLLVEGRIEACITTLKGKPQRLPRKVHDTLAPFVTTEDT
ncbi:MAG TPA: YbgC/FadM family acyl-CoA thioesterase [Rhizomicrobium sp.]|nr:YbgC/FadM family acyl-CoA thioesterase [Rhizomicrobium sp.]